MREAVYLGLLYTILKLCFDSSVATAKVIRSNENIRIIQNSEFSSDLQHLAIDRFSGKIFIGGRNKLYQLTADLNKIAEVNTGPRNEYIDCSFQHCANGANEKSVDNINKVLLIDYDSNRLIACGSFHGSCSTRHLSDITFEQDAIEWVVADTENASSVAFIAPGPSMRNVMYVGVTDTASSNQHFVPTLSSRSLLHGQTFTVTSSSTQAPLMPVPFNSNVPKSNQVNYVYAFSSDGFAYFLVTQPKNQLSIVKRDHITKLIRICHNDPHYYSLTEVPIECIGNGIKYNLAQAAYLGKIGDDLANEYGVTAQDDVLYTVFSTGKENIPSKNAALCIYPLKSVRKKFQENIQSFFNDQSSTNSPFFPTVTFEIGDDFCGSETNHPIEGKYPITAAPVLTFKQRMTAVAATKTKNGKSTVAYVGSADGYVTKLLIQSKSLATEYPDIKIDNGSPINADMHFDSDENNLYVMTKNRVAKVKVGNENLGSETSNHMEINNLEYVKPVIKDFFPKVGPKSGGTLITITGNNLKSSGLQTANIDGVQCIILNFDENQATCRTNPSGVRRFGKLQMVFTHEIRDSREFYQFVEDPTVTWVTSGLNGKKPKGIPTGGIKVFATGTNFNVVQQPHLFVHYGGRTFFSDCTVLNSEQMECVSPVIDVDSDQLSDDSVKLDYGFEMDDVESVRNLTALGLPKFKLCPNPWFEAFSPDERKVITDDYLVINGMHLDCACEEYDVLVSIGRHMCNVTSISRLQLICKPQNGLYPLNEDQKVTVRFGEKLQSDLGFVKFAPKHIETGTSGNIEIITSTSRPPISMKKSYSSYYKFIICGVIALLLILTGSTIYLCMRVKRERELTRILKAAGFASFEEGRPDSINPDMSLDEQAELLPYDRKYEFPREKLKLGKKLGSGAFGIVMQGVAQGILPYEDETVVAVKMVKRMSNDEVMKALISELKIMVHLGQHLNVVNLLGAVTKDIAQCNVMVIVEYCEFGNLQNFLIKNRKHFIDQIDRETGMIDSSLMTPNTEFANNDSQQYPHHEYMNESRKENSGMLVVNSAYCGSKSGYSSTGINSGGTEATVLLRDNYTSDNRVTSNTSMEPETPHTITTTDLLCWSFQITRGMQYLASRKVVHGDLAARNILLCTDNVVKICDFGLARSLYKTDIYKKEGEDPLPVKWLALESISDHVFSTKTDVWSFGVVLWELFSLGRSPYTGMSADHNLYSLLKNGYRMDKPTYATKEIYDIMLSCWRVNPESRPIFEELEMSISKFLDDDMAERYIDMNEPYLEANVNNYKHGKTDYIALMGAPEFRAPMTPTYVNASDIIDVDNFDEKDQEQDSRLLDKHSSVSVNLPEIQKHLQDKNKEEEISMTQYSK